VNGNSGQGDSHRMGDDVNLRGSSVVQNGVNKVVQQLRSRTVNFPVNLIQDSILKKFEFPDQKIKRILDQILVFLFLIILDKCIILI
jgi:hypothetical protein